MLKENSMSHNISLNRFLEENMVTTQMLNLSWKYLSSISQNKIDFYGTCRTREEFNTIEFDKLLDHIITQICNQPSVHTIK